MRIGIDMLAVQSPHHGHRGIGRYSRNLVSALLARDDGHEYVLYAHEGLPDERIPSAPRAQRRCLQVSPQAGLASVSQAMDALAETNPDALDVLVVLSAFEFWANYAPPVKPRSGLRLVSVVYDLIPFLFPREDVCDPVLMRHYRVLRELRRYDALLAISDATRDDCRSVLGLPAQQITNISAGSDAEFFVPDPREPMPTDSAEILHSLGIDRPYILNVGGLDERKNTWNLIDAFARLPEAVRNSHQLVLTFTIAEDARQELLRYAEESGIPGLLVPTGEVSDDALRVLYQRCALFAFPSQYEGFGLPILEAMQCGASVVAGNNSSQIEVVGDAGLLANASDVADISAKLERILTDHSLAQTFKQRALKQAEPFTWGRTASRAIEAIESACKRPRARASVREQGPAPRPRIAFFSPLPPRKSGISDYSHLLLQELKQTYAIDLFHDTGYIPHLAMANDEFTACDVHLFEQYASVRDYRAIVYQMGNSRYHHFLYELMLKCPGIVTLHDFCLAGFHLHYGRKTGRGLDYLKDELRWWYSPERSEVEARIAAWPEGDWEAISRDCAAHGWNLNQRTLSRSRKVIVHSPWCREQVRVAAPEYAERVVVIPHGIKPRTLTEAERHAIRDRFDIPRDALMIASFGFIHPDKMNPEALEAFQAVAAQRAHATFVFVGEDADGGLLRKCAVELGLSERVRFLGRASIADFADLAAVTDLGVNLRRPPTNGETSGALLYLLAAGVATIVTDVGTFADYPSSAVRKVRWEVEGIAGLNRAMFELAGDAEARGRLGQAAWTYVNEHHEWSRVAQQYVAVIEKAYEEQQARIAPAHAQRGPHFRPRSLNTTRASIG